MPLVQTAVWIRPLRTTRALAEIATRAARAVIALGQLSDAAADCLHTRHRERLEGNTVYRDSCSGGEKRTSIHRALDPTGRNEQYILVPDGDVVSFAT